jgi:hypothetical protein
MNDESKAALIEHLKGAEYDGKSAEESHLYFHSPHTVATVTKQLKQLTTALFFGILTPQSAGKVIDWNNLPLFIENIREQNRQGIGMLVQGLALAGKITGDEAKIAMQLLGESEEVSTETMEDAPIVRVLYGIRDVGRPNAIPLDEFTQCYKEAGR